MPYKPKKDALAAVSSRAKHGLYSWVTSKKVPGGRAFQAVRRELAAKRERLIERHGGEDITPEAEILIDNVIEGMGVQKILGLYVRKYGVIDGKAAKRGSLELSPILSRNWVGYANVVRQGILALRELEKGRQEAPHADIEAVLTSYSRQDGPAQEEQESAQDAQVGRAEAGEGQDQADRGKLKEGAGS